MASQSFTAVSLLQHAHARDRARIDQGSRSPRARRRAAREAGAKRRAFPPRHDEARVQARRGRPSDHPGDARRCDARTGNGEPTARPGHLCDWFLVSGGAARPGAHPHADVGRARAGAHRPRGRGLREGRPRAWSDSMKKILLALLAVAAPAFAARDCDPNCDAAWAKFTLITVNAIDTGSPVSAQWRVQFDHRRQDIRIDADIPGPNGRMRGAIALVGGGGLVKQRPDPPRGGARDAVERPALS